MVEPMVCCMTHHTEGQPLTLVWSQSQPCICSPAGWVDAGEEAEEQPEQDGADRPTGMIASVMAGAADSPSHRPQGNGGDSAAKIDVLRRGACRHHFTSDRLRRCCLNSGMLLALA